MDFSSLLSSSIASSARGQDNEDRGEPKNEVNGNNAPSEESWTLRIKQLDESDLELNEVNPNSTVLELKNLIKDRLNLPVNRQRMIFRGKVLENSRKLEDYSIKHQDCIHLLQRARVDAASNSDLNSQTSSRREGNISARRAFRFDPAELNRMINEQLTRSSNRTSSRQYRQGRLFAVGDNVEHIYQGLATLDTINNSISRKREIELEQQRQAERANEVDLLDEFGDYATVENNFAQINSDEETDSVEEKVNSLSGLNAFFDEIEENENRRCFKVGQWIDCLDTVNQWLEATVIQVSRDKRKIKVHYNGWGTRWDEVIDANSPRIARFRTKTRNRYQCKNVSPTICHWVENVPKINPDEGNDMKKLVVQVYKSMEKMLPELRKLALNEYSEYDSLEEAEKRKLMDVVEIAPRLDILGKAITDLGISLANRPNYRRRYEMVKVKNNPFSLLNRSILPFGLKASVERDRTVGGDWNRRQRKELLQRTGYDEHLFNMMHGPHELNFGDRRNRSLELHLHAILASDLRIGEDNTDNQRDIPRMPPSSIPSRPRETHEGAVAEELDEPLPEPSNFENNGTSDQ